MKHERRLASVRGRMHLTSGRSHVYMQQSWFLFFCVTSEAGAALIPPLLLLITLKGAVQDYLVSSLHRRLYPTCHGFPTRMVYLYNDIRWRYTNLVRNPQHLYAKVARAQLSALHVQRIECVKCATCVPCGINL